jgi:hypothetical protein
MSEDTAKKVIKVQTHRYNHIALNQVASQYGVTRVYVRQCINGTRKGITCDTLVKEYNRLDAKISDAIKS